MCQQTNKMVVEMGPSLLYCVYGFASYSWVFFGLIFGVGLLAVALGGLDCVKVGGFLCTLFQITERCGPL